MSALCDVTRASNAAASAAAPAGARTIAVASGKGGVGKTNLVANLAVALARRGSRVAVVDADLGLGNLDALLGLHPRHTLRDVLHGGCSLADAILTGPAGVRFVPAPTGYEDMTRLSAAQATRLLGELGELEATSDYLLIDTAAGISTNVLFFTIAAHETVVLSTPEPTALTDAYALVKVLATRYGSRRFDVVVNQVRGRDEAARSFSHFAAVAARFLGVDLRYRGFVPHDPRVGEAVRRQRLLLDYAPGCAAARAIDRFARDVIAEGGRAAEGGLAAEGRLAAGAMDPHVSHGLDAGGSA